MAADRQTEQIGLAHSRDGLAFERWNRDGLLIPRDVNVGWKALRTCNPVVIRHAGGWLMYYQGVGRSASGDVSHVIARARSADGCRWECDPLPCVTFDDVRAASPEFREQPHGGVIEPDVVIDGDELALYFIAYKQTYRLGTWLMSARSRDGVQWTIDPAPVVSSREFGDVRIHYPQITDAKTAWLSLISTANGASAIVRVEPSPSGAWSPTRQVLPPSRNGHVSVTPAELITIRFGSARPRGLSRLNQWANRLVHGGRNYWGYSHPHVMTVAGARRLYYHAYHRNAAGEAWMDIGSCAIDDAEAPANHRLALSPAADARAWDAFFVADPCVTINHG